MSNIYIIYMIHTYEIYDFSSFINAGKIEELIIRVF
jgi:hypothetical protein